MRRAFAILVALGIGVTAAVPVARAQTISPGPNSTFTNRYGNRVIGLEPGAGGGYVCYMDGVAYSCIQPARVTFSRPDSGTVAGPATPHQPSTFFGGDKN